MKVKGAERVGDQVDTIVGISDWARRMRADVRRVADFPMLISGPSGTGKELIARVIHANSSANNSPFVPLDCGALTGDLLISQMFGHAKGALGGTSYESIGAFRAASSGTIFLADIEQLDEPLQRRILQAIDRQTVTPLGSDEQVPIEVRIIAATESDPHESLRTGQLNHELFERFSSTHLKTVPLGERTEDIEVLAKHFLCKLSIDSGLPLKDLAPDAMESLLSHAWPGNVRQLFDLLELAVIFTEGELLGAESMPELIKAVTGDDFHEAFPHGVPPDSLPGPPNDRRGQTIPIEKIPGPWPTLAKIERDHILLTLQHADYNQSVAAEYLGINRSCLRRKIKDHGLDVSRSRRGRPSSYQATLAKRHPR